MVGRSGARIEPAVESRAENGRSGNAPAVHRRVIQNSIGTFFASKFRAAVLFAIYRRTGDPVAREQALRMYHAARNSWQAIIDRSTGVYRKDLTFGYAPFLRGSWSDRIAAIDEDIRAMEASAISDTGHAPAEAIQAALAEHRRPIAPAKHTPTGSRSIDLVLTTSERPAVILHFRHVNQSETWRMLPMRQEREKYAVEIPSEFMASNYPVQYYFEIRPGPGKQPCIQAFLAIFHTLLTT